MQDKIDTAAEVLVEWIQGIDPSWRERIIALRDERGFTPRGVLGACVGYVLDHGLHMSVPYREDFEGQVSTVPGQGVCPVCDSTFQRRYPSQPVCGNECAEVYYAAKNIRPPEKKPEMVTMETVAGPVSIPVSSIVKG